jgi:hypothetical protein
MRTRGALRLVWLAAAVVLSTAATLTGTRLRLAATVALSPDSISGVAGVRHTVTLTADISSTGKSLGSYSAAITWDSALVRLDSVRGGDFGIPLINYVNSGEVRLTQVNTTGTSGSVSLARLYFRIVNDTIGRRTPITLAVTGLTATDFTDLSAGMAVTSGVARILPPTVVAKFTPEGTSERVGFKPAIDLTADLSQAPGIALGSYTATVTWDPAVMLLDSVRPGDFAAPQINQSSTSELRLTAADAQGRSGAFSLARLYFSFLGATFPRQSALTLSVSEMHAAVTFANLLPGTTPRNGTATIAGVLRGDIDISGTVSALDAQVILLGVVGLSLPSGASSLPHGDADCDGVPKAKDAQIVLNLVVGNDVSQFCAGRIQ